MNRYQPRIPTASAVRVCQINAVLAVFLLLCMHFFMGCVYKGGKVIDGTNLALGVDIPGTDWTFSVLDYVSGIRVAGNESTYICVTNKVEEHNSYFGIVTTKRKTESVSTITPRCFQLPKGNTALPAE